ncbi:hypothetical protein T10_9261 [Trichinella papuae]|uniref:Uncharacterized protein n=2 Tax=Trichinella papuae TaxID=268474 RepID=A0A0V1LZJ4_9BILA|nr:hypothetical protein T10_9261 [Trichinella papuae]
MSIIFLYVEIIIVDTLNKFFSVFDDVFEEDIRSTVTCNSNKIQKCRNYKVLFVKSKIPDFSISFCNYNP